MSTTNPLDGIIGLTAQIKDCVQNGRLLAALTLSFVCIDTMAYLALPANKTSQTRPDFMSWVDRYLKADPAQQYQYRGVDVYAARCGLLHAFSAEAELHRKDPSIFLFGYHDGGQLLFEENTTLEHGTVRNVAMIGIKSFVSDIQRAVIAFISEMKADAVLRENVAARLPQVYQTFLMPASERHPPTNL